LADYLASRGFTSPDAAVAAQGSLLQQLQHQVNLLAFMNCFRILAWITLAAARLPLQFSSLASGLSQEKAPLTLTDATSVGRQFKVAFVPAAL
jgi:hypothetical protein